MATSARTDFRLPPFGLWPELLDLSDALATELRAGPERKEAGLAEVALPTVWRALVPLRVEWGGSGRPNRPGQGAGGRRGSAGRLPRSDPRVPSDERWRQLRNGRPSRAVELDLIALMPPKVVAVLDAEVLRSLGAGGAVIAALETPAERKEALLVGQTWDWAGQPDPPDDWVRFEAQAQYRADFYRTEELHDEVAVSAVADFLKLERRLHAGTPPKGRRPDDLNLRTRIEPLYERLRQAAKSGTLSSFGVIRVKLLRITANRLAGRHDAAREELAEATADLVYNADPTPAWLDLLDRISEEWAHFDSAAQRDPHAAALSTAS